MKMFPFLLLILLIYPFLADAEAHPRKRKVHVKAIARLKLSRSGSIRTDIALQMPVLTTFNLVFRESSNGCCLCAQPYISGPIAPYNYGIGSKRKASVIDKMPYTNIRDIALLSAGVYDRRGYSPFID